MQRGSRRQMGVAVRVGHLPSQSQRVMGPRRKRCKGYPIYRGPRVLDSLSFHHVFSPTHGSPSGWMLACSRSEGASRPCKNEAATVRGSPDAGQSAPRPRSSGNVEPRQHRTMTMDIVFNPSFMRKVVLLSCPWRYMHRSRDTTMEHGHVQIANIQ